MNIPVLDLENGDNITSQIRNAVLYSITENRSDPVVLGCAGMTDLASWLTEETHDPVIDGVTLAVCMVEALVGAHFKTSKIVSYAKPRGK